MKKTQTQFLALLLLAATLPAIALANEVVPRSYYGRIAQRLGGMLPRVHVLQQRLDDTISQRAWTNLVTFYDFDHSVFLKSDLERLAAHEKTIDDEIQSANVKFGYEVYNLYVERLRERIDYATNLIAAADWDFSVDETYRVRRKDAEWPATREEAEDQWRRRIKNEVLVMKINHELDKSTNELDIVTQLTKKYRQYAIVLTEPDEEAVLQHYLSAVCRAYDPHSDYFSPASKEDFDMEMNLSLCGVGAVLSMDDGALKINEVMPGGPIDVDGRIKVGDRIVGVGQGTNPVEDIMWEPMKKSIRKIRGPKGTAVTLEVIPRSDPSGMTRKRYELIRDEIKLEDQAATGRVEIVVHNDVTNRIGYIYLPGFYGTMDKRVDDPGYRSCADDVAKILADFNAQGVQGLALDLRGNGGGSLREALALSGLFVHEGPVVQIRDVHSVGPLSIKPGPVAFRKPMIVLTDRASASASEIVAGHLQDVDRAIIIGDSHTHGKGTVQSVLGMGPDKYGSCKITTARFYRINGLSTQVEGVKADIRLPSFLDSLEIGEDKLTYALPFTRILPEEWNFAWDVNRFVRRLSALSAVRVSRNEKYMEYVDNLNKLKAIGTRHEVPLEYNQRREMMVADREIRGIEDMLEGDDEAASIAGANPEIGDREEDADAADGDNDKDSGERQRRSGRRRNLLPKNDLVLRESLYILCDLIRFTKGEELPKPEGW